MRDWAKREVEIACKRGRGSAPEDESDYGCACYESALKAFDCLCGDGHSGMSIGFTQTILNRLIDGKPLTPIEDVPEDWNYCYGGENNTEKVYQCKRMGALFKHVKEDGNVRYSSVDQYYCKDINTGSVFTIGLASRIIEEMYPITLPYYPKAAIKVNVEEFLTDPKNGDLDTVGVFSAELEDGPVYINKFFAEIDDFPGAKEVYPGWAEISPDLYLIRKEKADKRRIANKAANCNECKCSETCTKKDEYIHDYSYCDDFASVCEI